jgi:hypothetical protein
LSSFCHLPPHCFNSKQFVVLKRPMHPKSLSPLTGPPHPEEKLNYGMIGIYHFFFFFWPREKLCLPACEWLSVCACVCGILILISRSSFETSTNFVQQTKQKNKKI